jgi:hypothetical protein
MKTVLRIIIVIFALIYLYYILMSFQLPCDYGIIYVPRTDKVYSIEYYRDFNHSSLEEILLPFLKKSVQISKPGNCLFVETLDNMERDLSIPHDKQKKSRWMNSEEFKKFMEAEEYLKDEPDEINMIFINQECSRSEIKLPGKLDFLKRDSPSFSFDVNYADMIYYPHINKRSTCRTIMTEKDAILITGGSADVFYSHYAALRYLDKQSTGLIEVKD